MPQSGIREGSAIGQSCQHGTVETVFGVLGFFSSFLFFRGSDRLPQFWISRNPLSPRPNRTGPFNLGRIWKVKEGYYDEPHWIGVWTRRGETNIFDATWKHCWMNETTQDVVEVQLAKDGQVLVFRQGVKQYYRATYSAQQPKKLHGRADWYGPDLIWTAEIEY